VLRKLVGLFPIPRQQCGQIIHWVIGDSGEDIGEPSLRIEIIELCGLCRPPNYAEPLVFPRFLADRRVIGSA
jgi:hypothetical protein